ncbi:MAG: peptidylprolyl isomerase [Bacteroidia bacterium]|nr:MAG: peptidylprolyl isomerase [Bacteroidia bacterium]
MKVEKNKVVSVSYELRTGGKEGDVKDFAPSETPLQFLFGSELMLEKFEENLAGLSVGENFEFSLTSADGYGERDEEKITPLPLSIFGQPETIEDGLLEPGNVLPFSDENGAQFTGTILSVNKEEKNVMVDFNHPLAGEPLYFTGKIEDIREATADEIAHGHIHGSCGCSGGGGHCHDPHDENHECCGGGGGGHCHDSHDENHGCCCKS